MAWSGWNWHVTSADGIDCTRGHALPEPLAQPLIRGVRCAIMLALETARPASSRSIAC
jgi:hypothetical protein